MRGFGAGAPLVTALLLACLVSLHTHAANKSAPSKEESKAALSDLHERIEALKKELDSSKEAHAEAADELKKSERAISEANLKLFELNQQHKQNSNTLQTLQQQKSELEATLQQQRQLLGAQLYQQYLNGQQSYIQVLLQQQDPGAIARQLHYFSYVSRARAELIQAMQANLGKVAKLNDQTASTLTEIAELKAQQEQERRELQSQKKERNKVLSQLSAKISAQRGEIDKLKRDEKRLSQLVEKLSRITRNIPPRRPSQKSTPGDKPGSDKPIARNEALPSSDLDGSNFPALKGKLNLPVRGDLANRFGATREDTGISWKGLFIRSSEGNEVKSVASGRVVFADWLRGFGNLLIIDHGDGYMSLYGNNQSLLRKVGEMVKGGDTVAAVGNSGGNEASGLYYELRYQSKPFDPLSWSVIR
ncbi:MAG TPA: peptidoglycan DD-metalloendopeptidase family protein [Methylophilaceae bacterium]|nr:peptidoglycan DD-metalloendopeptidase family protein [Methylophilaceae bacterium]